MIGLNWFEVYISASRLTFHHRDLAKGEEAPPTSRDWYTVYRRQKDGSVRLFYLSPGIIASENPLPTLELEPGRDPDLTQRAIDFGYAGKLREAGYEVRTSKVGSKAFRALHGSPFPDVFSLKEGLAFRAFFFRNNGDSPRWGIVQSYATSQQFNVNLADPLLRSLSINNRVVAATPAVSRQVGPDVRFVGMNGQFALLRDRNGRETSVNPTDWTLPCTRATLNKYLSAATSARAAGSALLELQRASFAVTRDGRMNTALSRAQHDRLMFLLKDDKLFSFRLPVVGQPAARISEQSLVIGERY